jgi:hypothetical protein
MQACLRTMMTGRLMGIFVVLDSVLSELLHTEKNDAL